MNTLLNKLKTFLSGYWAGFIVICLAITARIIQLVFYFNLHVDLSYQVLATRNLAHGHGISVGFVSINDLSTVIYEPLINWPPGFSLLFFPFYILFNGDYQTAGMVISLLSGVALIFISRSLLKLLDVPLYLINLFTFTTAFYIYFFYYINSSDAIAIPIFLTGIVYTLKYLKTGKQLTRNLVLMSLMMLLCASLKYLFVPAVFIIPLYLVFKGKQLHNPRLTRAAFASLIFLALSIGILLLYQKTAGGSAVYISSPERGYFPESLLTAYPVFPASFLKTDTLDIIFPKSDNWFFRIYQVFYCVWLIISILFSIRMFRKNQFTELFENDFLFLSFLLTIAIITVLAGLSFIVAPERGVWTYISEPRYHGLPNLFLQIGLFLMLGSFGAQTRRTRSILIFLFFLLCIEMGHGMFFTLNRIQKFNREEYSWQFESRFQEYAASLIKTEKGKHPKATVVVAGPVYYLNHRVSLHTGAQIINEKEQDLGWDEFKTKRPVLLTVIIPDDEAHLFHSFIEKHRDSVKGKFDQFSFYILYVQPGS